MNETDVILLGQDAFWVIIKVGGPILGALNRLTGQKVRDPDEWIALYKDHKKKPANLFVED